MFTGIIQKVSVVEKVSRKNNSLFVSVKIPTKWKVWQGESIAIDGVCSTVKSLTKKDFTVEYMPETIQKTIVGNFAKGTEVNLERSLKLNDLLDGHIVQGHVDTTGQIMEIKKVQESKVIKIKIPSSFMRLVVDKGSVTINGISLTVVVTGKNWFTISLVSYTLENTNLGTIAVGDSVNIETDVLAKYVEKLIKHRK
ncbi:MAG: riboflavin synthase [Candidatus Moranbacteria bacterium]|nr:riboflavin synthase [Candidatus Moranbacteria bacterium]